MLPNIEYFDFYATATVFLAAVIGSFLLRCNNTVCLMNFSFLREKCMKRLLTSISFSCCSYSISTLTLDKIFWDKSD